MRHALYSAFAVLAIATPSCVRYQREPLEPARTAAAIEARSLSDPGLRDFVQRNRSTSGETTAGALPEWDLANLTLAAFYYSPDLDVARAEYEIAQAGVVTAGQRPNPTLSVVPTRTVSETEQAATREQGLTPWALSFDLDIPLELFHKRGYRLARARSLADSARYAVAQTAWDVRDRVRSSLTDLAAARARRAVQSLLVTRRAELVRLLERRLAAGEASQLDVSRERTLRDQARLDLLADDRVAAQALSGLATSVGVPIEALERVDLIAGSADALVPPSPLPPTDSLRRVALLGRADVVAALGGYQAAESALALEVANQYPDLHLLPGLAWDRGEEKISFGASAVIPVVNQNRGPILEATAQRRAAASRVLQLQARVLGQLDSALAGYRSASAEVAAADSLLAAQRRTSAGVEAQFRAGEVDRVALVSTQIEISTIELTRLDALFAGRQALGRVEDAIQRPLAGGPVPADRQATAPRAWP